MNYTKRFLNGKWLKAAAAYLVNPSKLKTLVEEAKHYVGKKGMANAKEDLSTLTDFVKSVANGSYKGYDKSNLIFAVASLIYVVSPLDIIPDFIVGLGFLDDVAIVAWAMTKLNGEVEKYKAARRGRADGEQIIDITPEEEVQPDDQSRLGK